MWICGWRDPQFGFVVFFMRPVLSADCSNPLWPGPSNLFFSSFSVGQDFVPRRDQYPNGVCLCLQRENCWRYAGIHLPRTISGKIRCLDPWETPRPSEWYRNEIDPNGLGGRSVHLRFYFTRLMNRFYRVLFLLEKAVFLWSRPDSNDEMRRTSCD